MSYALGILGKRQRRDITIRPPTSIAAPATYDGWVNSFGADVVSYWKFQGNGTDEKGVQNAVITGSPELNVPTIVDLDRVSEGASSDGTCIAWPSTTTEYAQVAHNTAHKTVNGAIVITFQCDTLNGRSTLLAADANGAAGGIGMEVEPNGAARCYIRNSLGTANVLVSPAGTIQTNRAYTMIVKWGTGFSMAVWDESGNLVGSRITNPTTSAVTGTSPLRFGLYHTNVNAHDGPFGRVVWLSRRITDAEEANLARARTILHGVAPEGRFVALNGNNANPGTLALPYRTIEYGASQLLPGETLWVRGGRYIGDITITASGNATNGITIASYPGETAVIDVNYAEFQTINNGQWELDPDSPAGTEVYRSVSTSYGTGNTSRGTFFVNDVAVGTVLSGLRPYLGLAKIRSTTYEWNETYTYYGGPGFCFSSGRIYIRLQNLASPRNAGITFPSGPQPTVTPLGDITNHPPSSGGFNPNTFSINISDTRANVRIQGSYITLSRLAVYGGQYGIIIDGGHHVIIERCRLWGATHPVNSATATHDNILRWCDIDSGFSPCFSWFEIHTGGTDEHPRMESKIWSQSGLGDERNLLYQNLVRACFDGVSAVSSTTRDLRLIGNTILFLFDDLIQFTAQATFEVAYNYIVGPGPGYNGGPGAPGTAGHYFHHNILEDRRGEFGWRWNVGAVTTGPGPTPWRDSHNPFASHSVESDCNTPMKIYNNTILYRNNINARGARLERVGAKTGGLHEVYNNIVVGFSANCYVRSVTIGATDQIFDNNLMHHVGAYLVDLMRDMTGTPNNDYATLTAWRASQSFQDTKSVYSPGFEANSKEGDPQIPTVTSNPAWGLTTDDYRPSAAGIAASGAKNLSSTGWPDAPTTAYIGAVDPNASTGRGVVGIPSGVLIGPAAGEYITTPEAHGWSAGNTVQANTNAINAAIDDARTNASQSITTRGVVELVQGRTYLVRTTNGTPPRQNAALTTSLTNVEIRTQGKPTRSSGNQAILKMENWTGKTGVMYQAIISLTNVSNFMLGWVTLNGNKNVIDNVNTDVNYTQGQNGGIHAIACRDDLTNITIKEVVATMNLTDGILLVCNNVSNVLVEDCDFTRNRRNNLSVGKITASTLGYDKWIWNRCKFNNAGDYPGDVTGHQPGNGSDVEPDSTVNICHGMTFQDCQFDQNYGSVWENGSNTGTQSDRAGFRWNSRADSFYVKVIGCSSTTTLGQSQGFTIQTRTSPGPTFSHWQIENIAISGATGTFGGDNCLLFYGSTGGAGGRLVDVSIINANVTSINFEAGLDDTGNSVTIWKGNYNPTITTNSQQTITINNGFPS